ncbi:spore coat protein [Candidatus Peregrinibacteria bacterium CG_4_9_14_0_2_um_filter_53_11]|nr:MAG: spore coat protein [Candidatus Peregrinibacteria bacterium CG_4_9_14_0_2_um_filter_53_11]
MKGIILAGGNGRRLNPLTDVTNKHLLPVYDKPMIFYPLETLISGGIRDILIVTGKEYAGGFLKLLGSGREFGCSFHYEVQEDAYGIAHALGLAEDFVGDENCAVILGDNIYEDTFKDDFDAFSGGAHIFLKEMDDAYRFGVATVEGDHIKGIVEKPKDITKGLAVTGLYFYGPTVFDVVRNLKPSGRGELEITDVNNHYIQHGTMTYSMLNCDWTDAGTFESLYRANSLARNLIKSGRTTPFELLVSDRKQRQVMPLADVEEAPLPQTSSNLL